MIKIIYIYVLLNKKGNKKVSPAKINPVQALKTAIFTEIDKLLLL